MLKQVQHDIFHHFPNYDTVSRKEGVKGGFEKLFSTDNGLDHIDSRNDNDYVMLS